MMYKNLYIILLFGLLDQMNSQDTEIYETNQLGLKEITPSIIFNEDSFIECYEVYSINSEFRSFP